MDVVSELPSVSVSFCLVLNGGTIQVSVDISGVVSLGNNDFDLWEQVLQILDWPQLEGVFLYCSFWMYHTAESSQTKDYQQLHKAAMT